METLYKWRVQEKDKRGRMRWRIVNSPMTVETARFWAANNHKIIERVNAPLAPQSLPQSAPESNSGERASS